MTLHSQEAYDIVNFVAGLYDGSYLSDLTGFEARVIRRLVNAGVVIIEDDPEMEDQLVRRKL